VVVATTVLAVSLVGIDSVLGSQLLSISSTTTQQAGDGLLNQAMEEVRALPYQIVANGLSNTDATIATDPRIAVTGTAPNQTYTFTPTGEVIPHASLSYAQAPFVPHITTKTVDGTAFTVASYPSIDGTASGVYRVTVIVSWRVNPIGGVSRLSAQTLVYSGSSGCLTATNHPFAAPCQPFFYAQSSAGSGSSITATGTVAGAAFDETQMTGPQATSSMQIEQTSSVFGSAQTSGAEIDAPTGNQSFGSDKASSAADNDPGTPGGMSQTSSTNQSGLTLTVSGTGGTANSIGVASGWSDSGATTSTASATSNPPCSDLGGTTQVSGLPCGKSSVSQSGTVAVVQVGLFAGAVSLLSAPLVSSAPAPSPTTGFVGRYTVPTSSYCPTTNGDGCVHAGAQRSLGTLEIGGLPGKMLLGTGLDGAAPVGWGNIVSPNLNCPVGNYMVAMVNYSDRVTAESGVNANTATTTVPTGSSQPYVCFWNGTGYTSQLLHQGVTPQVLTIPTLTVTDSLVSSGAVTVNVTMALSIGSATTAVTTPNGCTTPCQSRATISSPLQGSTTYKVTQAASTIADLTITINLGELAVSTSYQAAP
jgi:hypothetical protein